MVPSIWDKRFIHTVEHPYSEKPKSENGLKSKTHCRLTRCSKFQILEHFGFGIFRLGMLNQKVCMRIFQNPKAPKSEISEVEVTQPVLANKLQNT